MLLLSRKRGFAEEPIATVVAAFATVTSSLPSASGVARSPLYTAVIACVPAARFDAVTTGTGPPLTGWLPALSRRPELYRARREAGDTGKLSDRRLPEHKSSRLAGGKPRGLGALVTVW